MNNGNGNGKGKNWGAFSTESLGYTAAEFVSMGTSLGVVAVADDIAPGILKHTSKAIGKILDPYMENIESGLSKVCKLEECQPDLNKPREERSERLAHTLIVFSAAWVISMAAKLGTRIAFRQMVEGEREFEKSKNGVVNFWRKHLKPDNHDKKVLAWDEGVHYGSLILMNTGMAKHTDEMIRTASGVLQKTMGWSKEKADRVSSMAMIWEAPNVLGWFAGLGIIGRRHFFGNGNNPKK